MRAACGAYYVADERMMVHDNSHPAGYLILFLVIALVTIFVTQWIAVPSPLGLVVVGLLLGIFGLLPEVHLTLPPVLFVFLLLCFIILTTLVGIPGISWRVLSLPPTYTDGRASNLKRNRVTGFYPHPLHFAQ